MTGNTTTRYRLFAWVDRINPDDFPSGEPIEAGKFLKGVAADMLPEEIIALSLKYDVMIQGEREENVGTRKKPEVRLVPATIWLDEKGKRFSVR
jgi:hypothetical protein